jgi:hypothetical protein
MKSYRLAIAGTPKKIAAKKCRAFTNYRKINVLTHVLNRHPALASGSGTCPISHYRSEIAYQHRPGTRSVAMRRGGGTGGSDAT